MMEEFAAQVFGMPKATPVSHDERQANNKLLDSLGFPSIRKTPSQEPTPTARELISVISVYLDVNEATAVQWMAERADEFKKLKED